jgi:hypothetical protein
MKVPSKKPYAMVGAGDLTASIWKECAVGASWKYGFNIFRLDRRNDRVTQRLLPGDIGDLIKLARVLAQVIADDGCLSSQIRQELLSLAASIDCLLDDEGTV